MKFNVSDTNRRHFVYAKYYLIRCRFAVVIEKYSRYHFSGHSVYKCIDFLSCLFTDQILSQDKTITVY